MSELRLKWLGPPALEYDDRPLRLEMRKTLALLAYISLSPQPPSRETLAAIFWPEFDQQHAMSNLRRNLSSLTQSLPVVALESDRERVALVKADWLHVDVVEFEALLAAASGHNHITGSTCVECTTILEKAVALYQGNFLEGFTLKDCPEFDDWQIIHRERLQIDLAGALSKLTDHYSSLNQLDKACAYARRWLSLDPLHEPAQLALIRLLLLSGQRSTALRQYESYTRLLKEEVNQQPSDAAKELYEQLCQKEAPGKAKERDRRADAAPFRNDYREQIIGPLLKTKLYIPGVTKFHLPRPRLVASLQGVETSKLTVISAPAGFGKTSLLAEWVASTSLVVCWLALDPGDNHLGRFFAYLIHSLQCMEESLGAEAVRMLHMPEPPPTVTILTSLLNDISALEEDFILILDDYHSINSQSIHEVISFILDHCPSQMHLMIASRTDPPIPLARMRLSGQLTEIRINDLRFSPVEAGSFLNQRMGLHLDESVVKTLNDRTEGWAAGLQMAAISMKGQENTDEFIQKFSGSHRFVMDYLVEEVFERQPQETKAFLLRTSILERLCAPLCEYVNSQQPSLSQPYAETQGILENLERDNLFLERLDEERRWYRYHHLFSELLQHRLQRYYNGEIPLLHTRAADWYEAEGMIPQAIHHALAAGDYERAACFVEKVAANLWEHGNYQLAFSWFETLPEVFVVNRPWLGMYRAWSVALDGNIELAGELLEAVERSNAGNPNPDDQRNLLGYIDYIRAVIADSHGDLTAMIRYDMDALEKLDVNNWLMRRGITFQLGRAYHLCGDQETSQQIWETLIRSDQQSGKGFASVISLCMLTWLKVAVGRLKEAETLCHEAAAWIEKVNEPHDSRTAGLVWIVFANVHFEQNKLDLAERYVQDAIYCFERMGNLYALLMGYVIYAGILRRKGELQEARLQLEKADALNQGRKIYADANAWHRAEKINRWLALGDLASAQQVVLDHHMSSADPVDFTTEIQYIALARVLIQQGCPGEAIQLLTQMAENAHSGKRPGRRLKILTVLALALRKEGRLEEAYRVLEQALEMAAPEGFVGIFVDSGHEMLDLLQSYLQSGTPLLENPIISGFIQALVEIHLCGFRRD